MKIKYKSLQLLVKFSSIQRSNILNYKLLHAKSKSIIPYTSTIKSIVLFSSNDQ